MIVTQAVQQSTPLHQFNKEEMELVGLGSKNVERLDNFIYKTISKW